MTTNPLVDLSDVTAFLPVRSGIATYDDKLTQLINVATQQIETATQRLFTLQTHTQYFKTVRTSGYAYDFHGTGNETGVYQTARPVRYVLRGFPVDTGAAFTVYYDPARAYGAGTVVDPKHYTLNPITGVLVLQLPTQEGMNYLRVDYTAGYAPTSQQSPVLAGVPADLKMGCIVQVAHLFNRLSPDNIGVDTNRGTKSVEPAKFTRHGTLCVEAASLVAPYRQPLLGRN